MRKEIVGRQVKAMQASGLEAMISCSPENFAYLTGFVVPSQPLIRHRHAMVIVTADGRTAIFGVDMEATTIRRREPDTPSRIWAEFTDNAMAVLADLLKGLGLDSGRIGIEMDYLPAGDYGQLRQELPQATFVANEAILAQIRQIKTRDEIDLRAEERRVGKE